MKERPILFSAPMVRALLSGSKSQTRRIVKPAPPANTYKVMQYHHPDSVPHYYAWVDSVPPSPICAASDWAHSCPYGQPGDRLWVRETFMDLQGTGIEHRDSNGKRQRYAYAAEFPSGSYGDEARKDYGLKWKPSIHMPRAASRITLEIVSLRVERLQDISESDAEAEGIEFLRAAPDLDETLTPRELYWCLWDAINGDGSWDANPWVWVVEFKRLA